MGKIECKTCGIHEHHHEHEHHHHEHDTKEQLRLIILTAVLLVGAVMIEHWLALETWQLLLVYLIPYTLYNNRARHAEGGGRGADARQPV